jgi:hypothetical protein
LTGTPKNDDRNGIHRLPVQQDRWGRFVVLLRTDGDYALCDWALPFGKKTISLHRTEAAAGKAADLASAEANLRGEGNSTEHS